MKKFIKCLFLTGILLLCSCSSQTNVNNENTKLEADINNTEKDNVEKSSLLYDKGLEIVHTLDSLAKDDAYIKAYTGSNDLYKIVDTVKSGEYSEPKAVYSVEISNEDFLNSFKNINNYYDMYSNISTEKILADKFFMSLGTFLSKESGATTLAACSMLSYNTAFAYDDCQTKSIYIYDFEKGKSIIVLFSESSNSAVIANGYFLFSDKFDDIPNIEYLQKELSVNHLISKFNITKIK